MPSAGHAANVIARALIPIFGVVFLGWSGTKLLVVFFADTLASIYALSMLVFYATATTGAAYETWVKDGLTPGKRLRIFVGIVTLPLPLLLLIGFFFGILPLFVMLDLQGVHWSEFLADRNLWIAVRVSVCRRVYAAHQSARLGAHAGRSAALLQVSVRSALRA